MESKLVVYSDFSYPRVGDLPESFGTSFRSLAFGEIVELIETPKGSITDCQWAPQRVPAKGASKGTNLVHRSNIPVTWYPLVYSLSAVEPVGALVPFEVFCEFSKR